MMRNATSGLVVSFSTFSYVDVTYIIITFISAPPFNGGDDYEILKTVKKGVYKFEEDEWSNISPVAK
jgi:hypothetical protein